MANDNFDMDASLIPDDFGIQSTEVLSGTQYGDFILGDSNEITLAKDEPTPPAKTNPTQTVKEEPSIKDEDIRSAILDTEVDEDGDVLPANSKPSKKESLSNQEESTDNDNTFNLLAKNLYELGIFNKLDDEEEEINTPEDFKEQWVKQLTAQSNSQIYNFLTDKHGEEGVELFNSLFVNGVDPKEYLSKYTEIQSLENIDLTEESTQEQVYKTYYKKLGWAEDKISKKIQKLKDYGELEEEATDAHEKLLELEQKELSSKKAQKEAEEEAKQQFKLHYAQSVNQILSEKLKQREFDGIPLTEKIARETYENLVVEKYKLPTGEKLTEFDKKILELRKPENYEMKVKLWLLLQNNLDLSKVKTKAISEKTDKLFSNMITKEKVNKRTNPLGGNNFAQFL